MTTETRTLNATDIWQHTHTQPRTQSLPTGKGLPPPRTRDDIHNSTNETNSKYQKVSTATSTRQYARIHNHNVQKQTDFHCHVTCNPATTEVVPHIAPKALRFCFLKSEAKPKIQQRVWWHGVLRSSWRMHKWSSSWCRSW